MYIYSIKSTNLFRFIKNVFNRNKSYNSAEWLERRLKDPYIEKAKMQNYRCRSAFKLIEIDDRFKIIKPGQYVIDIGAAPGSWTQVLVQRTNALGENPRTPKGTVISVDRLNIYPVKGAKILSGMDFTSPKTLEQIEEITKGEKLHFVFSDMAPNASGVKSLDSDNIYVLALSVLSFAVKNLSANGGCLLKMWEGRHEEIFQQMNKFFNQINYVKPNAIQKGSSEIFLLARNFKGLASS